MPFTCLPSSRSREGIQGTSWNPKPLSIIAKRPGGKRQSSAINSRDVVPCFSRQMRLPGFRGETPSDHIELSVAQRTNQVAPECNPISVTSRQPLLRQGIDPPIKRRSDLGAKARARELGQLRATSRRSSQVAPSAATC